MIAELQDLVTLYRNVFNNIVRSNKGDHGPLSPLLELMDQVLVAPDKQTYYLLRWITKLLNILLHNGYVNMELHEPRA